MATHPKTLFEKIWDTHLVAEPKGEPALLYVDLHLLHEVTSPQAFEGLRLTNRTVRRPDRCVATVDHNVPTTKNRLVIEDAIAAKQIETLRHNCKEFGIELYDVDSNKQGIVHIIGPEQGFTKPGMTIVCGDSHTSTHGAFGALAFGIGTSEVEHVLATQCLPQSRAKTFRISVEARCRLPSRRRTSAGHHWPHRHRWRNGLRRRVCGFRYPRAFDGRPYDALQYEHRGRRTRGHDCARCDDVRLPERPSSCAEGQGVGAGCRGVEQAVQRSGREIRPRADYSGARIDAIRDVGNESGHGGSDHRDSAGSGCLQHGDRPPSL